MEYDENGESRYGPYSSFLRDKATGRCSLRRAARLVMIMGAGFAKPPDGKTKESLRNLKKVANVAAHRKLLFHWPTVQVWQSAQSSGVCVWGLAPSAIEGRAL